MTYKYVTFNGSPVFASNEYIGLENAQSKLKNKFPEALVGVEDVPEHHLTSALRLRIIPEVRELLGNI
ncbi:TPA: hypothetical protein ACVU1J_003519 [Vibrio cholerae]